MRSDGRAGVALAAAVAAAAFAVLVALGTWQLQRLAWKEAVVARVAARVDAAPVPVPPAAQWAALDLQDWEYRPVRATGAFDHDREARVYTLLSDNRGVFGGPGYSILTPLVLSDGSGAVIVNRGFVPLDRAVATARPEGQVAGEVTVTGLLRAPEERNLFTPEDEPDKGLFYARDPAPIAEAYRLAGAAPFTIDADATPNPGGLPQGGETRLAFPNRHLEYAITWYGLAASLAGVFGVWLWGRRRAA